MDYKILLADDSVTVQKIITLTFKDEGVEVVTADNGDEAINRLQYLRPDLVMADVSIPGKNGYEICEFIKNHPDLRETPVVLLVPAFEPFDEERAHKAGVDRYLTKPIQSISTLISTVMSLVAPERKIAGSTIQTGSLSAGWEEKRSSESEAAEIVDVVNLVDSNGNSRSERREVRVVSLGSADLLNEFGAAGAAASSQKTREVGAMDPVETVTGDNLLDLAIDDRSAGKQIDVEEDMDSILELDDVLADVWGTPRIQSVTIDVLGGGQIDPSGKARILGNEAGVGVVAPSLSLALPQNTIDEIVNRVVAQLMERLPEILSRELAGRIVPEVAELVKTQQDQRPDAKAAYRDEDSLLELDEI